jgi:hypothetical protein
MKIGLHRTTPFATEDYLSKLTAPGAEDTERRVREI